MLLLTTSATSTCTNVIGMKQLSCFGSRKNVDYCYDLDSEKLDNKAVACFNLAYAFLKMGNVGDIVNMLDQLIELQTYVTPSMNVYSNLIQTGFSMLVFASGSILRDIVGVEEFIRLSIEKKLNSWITNPKDFSRPC